jgi:hypothetical protein
MRILTPRCALRIPSKPDIDAMRGLLKNGTDVDLELQHSVLADDGAFDRVCWNWMAITKPGRAGRVFGIQYFRNPRGDQPFEMLSAFPAGRPNVRARLHVTEAVLRFAFWALDVAVVRTQLHADRHQEIDALKERGFEAVSSAAVRSGAADHEFMSFELSEARFQSVRPKVNVEMVNPHVAAAMFGLSGDPRGL